jgi:hypothetical protein
VADCREYGDWTCCGAKIDDIGELWAIQDSLNGEVLVGSISFLPELQRAE